jgi:hypothetical protein
MSDIYARQRTQFQGSFPSDQAAMTIAGNTIPLGIVQQAQVTFTQDVARIYDVGNGGQLGTVPVFYVGGRTMGNGVLQRVLGPQSGALCRFYEVMGDVCSPQDITFTFAAGCGTGGSASIPGNNAVGGQGVTRVSYLLEAVVLTSVGIRVAADSMIVQDDVTIMFANMRCDEGANLGSPPPTVDLIA